MISSGSKIYTTLAVILAIGLLGLSNCKPPDEPFDDTGEPVFELKGTIDGSPLQIIAGVNGYYMFTDYTVAASDSIYRFSGLIANDSCTTCPSLEVVIGDDNISTSPQSVDITTALQNSIQFFDITKAASKTYTLQFIAEDSGAILPRYRWDFGNGDTSNQKNPIYTFTDSSTRNVCLTVLSDNGCSSTICNTIKPFEVNLGDSTPPIFDYTLRKTIVFRNSSFGLSYFWDFGDGTTSNAYEPEHQYSSPGTYRVCVTVGTLVGLRTYCKNVVINDPSFTCLSNFSYQSPSVLRIPQSFLSKVIIRYTDERGETYESGEQEQPINSFFDLVSYKDYLLNENGEKTQQLNVNFKCRLYNTNGTDFKDIEVTNGVIAVAHP